MSRWMSGIFAILLLNSAFAAEDVIKLNAAQRNSMSVEVKSIEKAVAVFGKSIPAQVVIPPAQMRMVAATQAGMIDQIMVSTGETVKQGQILAYIQSPEVIALQRDYLQAMTKLKLAKASLQRDKSLLKEGVIATRRMQETRSKVDELSAALDEHKQALSLAGISESDIKSLAKTSRLNPRLTVRSPLAGVVLEAKVESGQRVAASDPLFRVAVLSPLWLEIKAPLEQLPQLGVGAHMHVLGTGAEGTMIAIGRNVDPTSQTVTVRAEVSVGVNSLRPGQFVQVALTIDDTKLRYQIPSNAVVRSAKQSVVFVETDEGFIVKPVTVLSSQAGIAFISGDFKGDERVAIKGIAAIKGAWLGLGGGE
ncbi:MAG: efflux RND transporter periplasmic adaptor subunit [Gammaproteobacteria bacterium]|nr:efflux RND transporter periplasmic adaptor subunit [Gammaproteobacteria bacterium]